MASGRAKAQQEAPRHGAAVVVQGSLLHIRTHGGGRDPWQGESGEVPGFLSMRPDVPVLAGPGSRQGHLQLATWTFDDWLPLHLPSPSVHIQPYRNSRYSSGRTPSGQGETIASLRLGSIHLNFMSAHFSLPPAPEIEETGRPIWINSPELRQHARKSQAVEIGRVLTWLPLHPVSTHRALKSMHRTHYDMSRTSVVFGPIRPGIQYTQDWAQNTRLFGLRYAIELDRSGYDPSSEQLPAATRNRRYG
ncbi:hypothetical protein K456DRAFT_34832 [Colletotrichum gloeosporioides 23]|nr:hypothetical protein K456DRAFT_34832 [Colletotrichum gloeosporioides 23]